MELDWKDLINEAVGLAEEWQLKSGRRLILGPLPLQQGLLALFAGIYSGATVVFDEKSSYEPRADDKIASFDKQVPALFFRLKGEFPEEGLARLERIEFLFASSGSTRAASLIAKSGKGLLREAYVLREHFGLNPAANVAALVRPFHIYGFLHGLLLPAVCGCATTLWDLGQGLPRLEDGFPANPDLLVSVPAHFHALERLWLETRTPQLVSSGAPFGEARTHQLQEYASRYDACWEILGSTETGGIGFRRLDKGDEDFHLFPDVDFQETEEGTRLYSPFLWPESSCLIHDRLLRGAGRRFRHAGRSDRVFKYGGLRHSLTEIEDRLSLLSKGAKAICHFLEDPARPQGGTLRAWIEAEAQGDLRQAYLELGPLPYPQRIEYLAEFPRDPQGKVVLARLIARS